MPHTPLTADSVDHAERELLQQASSSAPVCVAVIDRDGRLLLSSDPVRSHELEPYRDASSAREAVRASLSGKLVQLTHREGDASYVTTFLPARNPDQAVDSAFAVTVRVAPPPADTGTRNRGVFDSNLLGVGYWDESGAIFDANDAFLAMLGFTREELERGCLDWRALTPPKYRAIDAAAMEQVKRTGTCTPFEKQFVGKGGKCVDVLIGASNWYYPGSTRGVAFIIDITESKQRERAQRDVEETLRRVLEAVPVVLWSLDAAGTFTLSTGRGLAALGLEPDQVLGQSVYDLYAHQPQTLHAVRRCLAGEELFEVLKERGRVFDTMLTPLRDASGAVNGMLGVSIDVTERKRAEAEQEKLRAQLLQVQKLESLGLLAGGIAHDFNNILTPILGAASAALLKLPQDSPACSDLELVIAAAERAASLTRQMLAYSGKAHVEIRPLDISTQVQEIAGLLHTTVSKKARLQLDLRPELPAVEADVAQLQQVVMNLVINGAESIGDRQGTVRVATGTQHVSQADAQLLLAAESLTPGEYVFLEVQDTGHGMDEATKERIFDPFFTTKQTGRGLGLSAVLGIVRSHRGAIQVSSSPGQGTSIKVLVPAMRAAPPAAPAKDARAPQWEFRGEGLVLVIDDDPSVCLTLRRIFEHLGFSVIEAHDGELGAELCAAHAAELVLAIVDMTMPKRSGEETLRALREIRPDLPVILASGYSELEVRSRSTRRAHTEFLEKPFTVRQLVLVLQKLLGERDRAQPR